MYFIPVGGIKSSLLYLFYVTAYLLHICINNCISYVAIRIVLSQLVIWLVSNYEVTRVKL